MINIYYYIAANKVLLLKSYYSSNKRFYYINKNLFFFHETFLNNSQTTYLYYFSQYQKYLCKKILLVDQSTLTHSPFFYFTPAHVCLLGKSRCVLYVEEQQIDIHVSFM